MKIYRYKTKVGTFIIKQSNDDPGVFQLWIGDELLGGYASPLQAADDVYMQATGYYEWDSLDPSQGYPHDISEWEIINL